MRLLLLLALFLWAPDLIAQQPTPSTPDLQLTSVQVHYDENLDLLIFEQEVVGKAGGTLPKAVGALDGAPVLGHVFPTSLAPRDVGFGAEDGIVALAVTSHPDFDDTPLWDENNDGDYTNDGIRFHTHWVLLGPDDRVPGGLAVREVEPDRTIEVLPPTNPGLPMFMDSPGFSVLPRGQSLRVLVPAQRLGHRTDFRYDGVTAYMEVNTSDPTRPMLGVYEVYSVMSGDLSLPYAVRKAR